MKPTDFGEINCSIARTYDVVGERWTLLIIREAFFGTRRFDDFQRRLGVARNILASRLETLVEAGVLKRKQYQDRPPRFEYRLTEKGLDLHHLLLAIKAWGDRWTDSAAARPLEARHDACGHRFEVRPTCSHCGGEVTARTVTLELGAGATSEDHEHWNELKREREARRAARTARPTVLPSVQR